MQNPTKVQNCANIVRQTLKDAASAPLVGIILGTGLGDVASFLKNPVSIPFSSLPGFPIAHVASHDGQFLIGSLENVPVIIQQGRCHIYEGYTPADVCLGTRIMASVGAKTLIVTNAAGALNPQFNSGDVMVIADHINQTGVSPLTGMNHDGFGPRFPDMSRAYDAELRALAHKTALEQEIRLEQGVYVGVSGPQMETPAETRMFRMLGADAVGMSTVLEVIAARHMGMRVLGFSCLSNKNLPDCMVEAPLEEVIRVAGIAGKKLSLLLQKLIPQLR